MFTEIESHAVILVDEMAIKPGLNFDNTTSSVIRWPTMRNAAGAEDNIATHALVFMLAGKTVAYEFTSNSFSAEDMLNKIKVIIEKAHSIGIKIHAVISDMGDQNRGFWKRLNIVADKHSQIKNHVPLPIIPQEKLFIMPDMFLKMLQQP